MAHNPITLDLLRALDAIDQRGSFAAAAQALHKVPSALTYTVQKVEQDLGIDLFDRSGHRAKLTSAGRLILNDGREILRDIDALANSAKKVASGWEPELRIGVDSIFEPARLYPLVQQFTEENPFIKVHLLHGALTGTWEMLINGTADLILTSNVLDLNLEGFDTEAFGTMHRVFAVAASHPLAESSCTVTEDEIAAYPTIVVRDTTQLMTPKTVGWTRHHRLITVSTMQDKIDAQIAGLGVGYLPQHRIQQYLDSGELVPLKVDQPQDPVRALKAWRKGFSGKGLDWFMARVNAGVMGIEEK